jgi:hypothetical protein
MATASQGGNLDVRSQTRQLRLGLVALAVALAFAAALTPSGVAHLYRGLIFVPFFVAVNGVLAAFYGTCGLTAASGRRMTSDGAEPVADPNELAQQRRTGVRVLVLSAALATVATVLFVNAT